MIGDFIAFYLGEDEFKRAIELNKKFEPSYHPYLSIRIIQHFSESTFQGILCNDRVFDRSKCLKRNDPRPSGILDDYNNKKMVAFTFDGVRFFRISNIAFRSDEEGLAFFNFQYIQQSSFSEKNTAFMIMPFRYPELNEFYQKNIKQYLESCDLKINVGRSDEHTGTDVVADTILEQIRKAEFIICDITNCNKNVFFEIGYAKGIRKDVIFLLEQNKPAEFFDVNHVRRIEYSYEREEEFQLILRETLISVRNNRIL
jgi:hypothetical protein